MSPGTDIQSSSPLFIAMLMSCRLMLLFCAVRPSLQYKGVGPGRKGRGGAWDIEGRQVFSVHV